MEVDTYLLGDRNRLSSLATFANHLALLLLLCGTLLTSWFSWRQELTLAPGEVADVGHGTGLGVSCEGFAISRYEDGSAAFYEASVRFLANGVTVGRGSVRLNEPLVRHGFRLYLRSYSGQEGAYTVTLLAAYDPGFAFVIMGGALLLLGLVVTFHLPYACLYARVTEGGAVLLAGRADRHDYGFAREFAALVAELGQDARGGQNAG
jgi:cytochrome c biogenesis protein ResB